MDNRTAILNKVKKNQPISSPHPGIPSFDLPEDLIERFGVALSNIGGELKLFPNYDSVIEEVGQCLEDNNNRSYLSNTNLQTSEVEPHTTIVRGEIAVAENAAVYVNTDLLPDRAIPFLGFRLIVVLPQSNLCYNMHQAYAQLDIANHGFGVFIAGPSATADIAQVLVRGAHGPSKMEVWMYK
ncbi:LutC/YkgG family protein [Membranihabitans marinus]|uniref:LutC/YkgG family protein n=1 Tax=Membranihabitans marinus TaxID=1227546 RepID=UPI001F230350|nr:LUD domain-containing protein [Membranihabitans marinus]